MKIEKIDHISFAVRDLEATKKVYKKDLGLEPAYEYSAPSEKIRVARYLIGEVAVELMESTAPDGEVALGNSRSRVYLLHFGPRPGAGHRPFLRRRR